MFFSLHINITVNYCTLFIYIYTLCLYIYIYIYKTARSLLRLLIKSIKSINLIFFLNYLKAIYIHVICIYFLG